MITEERQAYILDVISRKNIVKLRDLISNLDASESTIRRDLDELESKGLLKRVHGGAVGVSNKFTPDYSMDERQSEHIEAKKAIANYCADLVTDGDFVYLDSGTTTAEIIPLLRGKNITVVTNGIVNAQKLLENNINTYILGGKIKPSTTAIIGEQAMKELKGYRFNYAFVGANGISYKSAITTPDTSEACIKELAISLAKYSYIVADSSKFDKVSFAKICDFSDVTIITNKLEDDVDERIIEEFEVVQVD